MFLLPGLECVRQVSGVTAEVNLKNFIRLHLVLAAFCLKTKKKPYSNHILFLWSIFPSDRRKDLKHKSLSVWGCSAHLWHIEEYLFLTTKAVTYLVELPLSQPSNELFWDSGRGGVCECFDQEVGERQNNYVFFFCRWWLISLTQFKLESSSVFKELSGKILVLRENHLWFLHTTWTVGQGVLWICIVSSRKLCWLNL